MDIVFIEDLRIDAVIGIYDWERRVRQTLSFDIEMAFDNTVPAAADDIKFDWGGQGNLSAYWIDQDEVPALNELNDYGFAAGFGGT